MSDKTLEVEGRCPLCGRAMPHRGRKSLTCDKVVYTFPFRIYYCRWHGYWVWRKNKHELVDFSKVKHQAIRIQQLSPESPDTTTVADYLIVKMECPYCEGQWEQYDKTWTSQSGAIFCPFCDAEIPKEKAKNNNPLFWGEIFNSKARATLNVDGCCNQQKYYCACMQFRL